MPKFFPKPTETFLKSWGCEKRVLGVRQVSFFVIRLAHQMTSLCFCSKNGGLDSYRC